MASPRPVNSNITSEKMVANFLVVLENQTYSITGVIVTSLGNSSLNLVSGLEI